MGELDKKHMRPLQKDAYSCMVRPPPAGADAARQAVWPRLHLSRMRKPLHAWRQPRTCTHPCLPTLHHPAGQVLRQRGQPGGPAALLRRLRAARADGGPNGELRAAALSCCGARSWGLAPCALPSCLLRRRGHLVPATHKAQRQRRSPCPRPATAGQRHAARLPGAPAALRAALPGPRAGEAAGQPLGQGDRAGAGGRGLVGGLEGCPVAHWTPSLLPRTCRRCRCRCRRATAPLTPAALACGACAENAGRLRGRLRAGVREAGGWAGAAACCACEARACTGGGAAAAVGGRAPACHCRHRLAGPRAWARRCPSSSRTSWRGSSSSSDALRAACGRVGGLALRRLVLPDWRPPDRPAVDTSALVACGPSVAEVS